MNTKLSYIYEVDGAKTPKSIILSGELSREDIDDVARALHSGHLFIPDQVGLVSLAGGSENDHIWHTLDLSSATPTLERANAPVTAAELVDNFRGVVWDVTAATGRLYGCEVMHQKVQRPYFAH